MTDPIVIGFNQNKWLKDSNTKMLTISKINYTSGTYSLEENQTDYQVPVGKKFTLLNASFSGNNNYEIKMTYGGSPNVAGTEIMRFGHGNSTGAGAPQNVPLYSEISAGNYITVVSNGTDSYVTVIGVEEDA